MNFCFGRGSIPRRVWRAGAPPFLARKSGGHCTHPTGGPSFALNIKKLDEAQKAEEVLRLRRSVFWVHPIQNSDSLWLHFGWLSSRPSLISLADRLRHGACS